MLHHGTIRPDPGCWTPEAVALHEGRVNLRGLYVAPEDRAAHQQMNDCRRTWASEEVVVGHFRYLSFYLSFHLYGGQRNLRHVLRGDLLNSDIPEWLKEFRENLVDDRLVDCPLRLRSDDALSSYRALISHAHQAGAPLSFLACTMTVSWLPEFLDRSPRRSPGPA